MVSAHVVCVVFCIALAALTVAIRASVDVDCGSRSDNFSHQSLEIARLVGDTGVARAFTNESTPLIAATYETYRYTASNESEWGYDVFVPPGYYHLTLLFAETDARFFAAGERRFDVEVEGVLRERALDVFREAGNRSHTPVERTYPVHIGRNVLSFRLIDRIAQAKLYGFKVVRTDAEELVLPFLVNVGSDFQADSFLPDVHRFRTSNTDVLVEFGSEHPTVFQTARIGNISYDFPANAAHTYDITLHFAELDRKYMHEGARVFTISANNITAEDIDIYREAGERTLTYTFKSVPTPDARLYINLNAHFGSPILNAITIDRDGSHTPSGKSIVIRAINLGGGALQGYESDNTTLATNSSETAESPASWIAGTTAPELYRTYRKQVNDSGIELSIPVEDITKENYSIDLLFAEMEQWKSGARVMDIYINSMRRQTVDIYDMFGAGAAAVVRFSRLRPTINGTLDVRVIATTGNATLSGFILRKDLNDGPAPAWTTVPAHDDKHAHRRHENCAVEFDGALYLIGGRRLQPVSKFDTLSRNWTELDVPPIEVHHMQCVVIDERVAVGMAFTGDYPHEKTIDRLLWFHPRNGSWTWGDTIPTDRNRGSAAAIAHKDTLYFINGNVGGHGAHSTSVAWFDAYHVHNHSWSVLPDSPAARDHGMAAITGDRIVIAGGRDGGKATFFDATVAQVDVWRFDEQRWITAADVLVQPSGGALVAALDERRVVIAGGEGFGRVWPRTAVFDPLDLRFVDLAQSDMVTARHGTQLVRCGDTLYTAFGAGWQGGEPELTSVEAFTIDGRAPKPSQARKSYGANSRHNSE